MPTSRRSGGRPVRRRAAQREETSWAFPRDGKRHGVQTPFERRLENRRLARRRDRHAVAPPRDPLGLVEDPDLLPAPSQGRFGVEDTHIIGLSGFVVPPLTRRI